MNIPIEALLAMLAIEFFRAIGPEGLRVPATGVVLASTAGWIAFQYVLAAWLASRTRRKLRRARGSTVAIVEDFRFRLVVHRVVLVALCFAHTGFICWPAFVENVLGLPAWSVLDDVVAILPFVAALAAGWMATYRADKMLSRRPWGIGEFVWFQARYSLLLVLLPWLLLRAIVDSHELWPEGVRKLAVHPVASVVFFVVLVGVSATFLPLFLKRLFRAVSMPPSDIRSRLEGLLARAGLGFRDVLVWRMGRARILNAGVMGIVPRYRYVLFSDALLEALTPAECEAVMGHEIGHAKHRHVLVYLILILGFFALWSGFRSLLPPYFSTGSPFQTDPFRFLVEMVVVAILLCVYIRLVFGFLSRTFEREADVCAAELMGTPVPLILALEKIALMSGDVRELHSWRHHSVAERVRYLSAVGYDAAEQARYHGRTRRIVWGLLGVVVLLFAGVLCFSFKEPKELDERRKIYEDAVIRKPWDDHLWAKLGDLRAENGDTEGARVAYGTALSQNPENKDAIEGLKRLDIPRGLRERTLATAFKEAGRTDLAYKSALKSLKMDPDDPLNPFVLAEILLDPEDKKHYDPDWAAREARSALDLERARPGGPRAETYEILGRALLESGRKEEAREIINEGLKLYPQNKKLKALLERVKAR
ncbi:MAG: M48 family metalloprotease [Planctomycetota bacterium]